MCMEQIFQQRVRIDKTEQMCYNGNMDYTIVEFNGQQARQYPNGDIRNEYGQVLKLGNNRLDVHTITSENAHSFHKMRKEKVLKAIEAGVMRVTDAPNPAEAIGYIVSKRAELAMTDNTRVGNDAARIVLQALDAFQDKTQESIQTERKELVIDPDTMRIVEAMVRMRRDGVEITAENITEIK